ncbi:hypothetical protein D3C86_1812290 [compost metagenome]
MVGCSDQRRFGIRGHVDGIFHLHPLVVDRDAYWLYALCPNERSCLGTAGVFHPYLVAGIEQCAY